MTISWLSDGNQAVISDMAAPAAPLAEPASAERGIAAVKHVKERALLPARWRRVAEHLEVVERRAVELQIPARLLCG